MIPNFRNQKSSRSLSVGTSRNMALKYGFKKITVCPLRWWEEDQENHGVN